MRKVFSKVALAAAALVGMSTSANAYVFMRLADLNPTTLAIQTSIQCNTSMAQGLAAGTNCALVDGFLNYSLNGNNLIFQGNVGGFHVTTTSGVGNQPGTPTFANLNTSSTRVFNSQALATGLDAFYIDFRGFDFMFPSGEEKTLFGSASATTPNPGVGESVNTFFYASAENNGADTNGVSCNQVVTTNSSCNSGAPILWDDPVTSAAGFSLRSQQFFRLNGQSLVNTTADVVAGRVPEPVSTSLVGLGLLGLAVASRRKAKKA